MNSDNTAKQLSISNPRPNEIEQSQDITQAIARISNSFGSLEEYRPVDRRLKKVRLNELISWTIDFTCFGSGIMGLLFLIPGVGGIIDILFLPEIVMIEGITLSDYLVNSAIGMGILAVTTEAVYLSDEADNYDNYNPRNKSLHARLIRLLSSKKRKAKILDYLQKEEISNTENALFKKLVEAKKKEFAGEIEMINSAFDDRQLVVNADGTVEFEEFENKTDEPELSNQELIARKLTKAVHYHGKVKMEELSR